MSPAREGNRECWTPIESNPEVFTQLAQNLGLAKSLTFQDIWTLDADSTSFLLRPVHALVLVFPTDDEYEQNKIAREDHLATSDSNHVIWFKQTIYNACGLYGYSFSSLKAYSTCPTKNSPGFCMLFVTARLGTILVGAQ